MTAGVHSQLSWEKFKLANTFWCNTVYRRVKLSPAAAQRTEVKHSIYWQVPATWSPFTHFKWWASPRLLPLNDKSNLIASLLNNGWFWEVMSDENMAVNTWNQCFLYFYQLTSCCYSDSKRDFTAVSLSFRDSALPGRVRKGLQRVSVHVPLSGCLLISLLANDFRGDEGESLAGVGRLLRRLTHFATKPRPPRCLYWLCSDEAVWMRREDEEEKACRFTGVAVVTSQKGRNMWYNGNLMDWFGSFPSDTEDGDREGDGSTNQVWEAVLHTVLVLIELFLPTKNDPYLPQHVVKGRVELRNIEKDHMCVQI